MSIQKRTQKIKIQFFNNIDSKADGIMYFAYDSLMSQATDRISSIRLYQKGDREGTRVILIQDKNKDKFIPPSHIERKKADILESQWLIALDHTLYDYDYFFGSLNSVYTDWAIKSTQHKTDLIKAELELWRAVYKFNHQPNSYLKKIYRNPVDAWVNSQLEWKNEDYFFLINNSGSKKQQENWRRNNKLLEENKNPFCKTLSGLNEHRSHLIEACLDMFELIELFEENQSSKSSQTTRISSNSPCITRDKYEWLKRHFNRIWLQYKKSIKDYLHVLREGFTFENELVIPCIEFCDGNQILGKSNSKNFVLPSFSQKAYNRRSALKQNPEPKGLDFLTQSKTDLSLLKTQLGSKTGVFPVGIRLSSDQKWQ